VFIRVHPRPKKFGVCRGVLPRARSEFGVQGDKTLFLALVIFHLYSDVSRSVFTDFEFLVTLTVLCKNLEEQKW
jgi:hypothetical protein